MNNYQIQFLSFLKQNNAYVEYRQEMNKFTSRRYRWTYFEKVGNTPSSILNQSFAWANTKQDYDFWTRLYIQLTNLEDEGKIKI